VPLDLALAFGDLFEALTRSSARSSRDGDDGGSRARPGGIGGAADLSASFQDVEPIAKIHGHSLAPEAQLAYYPAASASALG
jgi:hypothetical protein